MVGYGTIARGTKGISAATRASTRAATLAATLAAIHAAIHGTTHAATRAAEEVTVASIATVTEGMTGAWDRDPDPDRDRNVTSETGSTGSANTTRGRAVAAIMTDVGMTTTVMVTIDRVAGTRMLPTTACPKDRDCCRKAKDKARHLRRSTKVGAPPRARHQETLDGRGGAPILPLPRVMAPRAAVVLQLRCLRHRTGLLLDRRQKKSVFIHLPVRCGRRLPFVKSMRPKWSFAAPLTLRKRRMKL